VGDGVKVFVAGGGGLVGVSVGGTGVFVGVPVDVLVGPVVGGDVFVGEGDTGVGDEVDEAVAVGSTTRVGVSVGASVSVGNGGVAVEVGRGGDVGVSVTSATIVEPGVIRPIGTVAIDPGVIVSAASSVA
jgi:hypothetical protein